MKRTPSTTKTLTVLAIMVSLSITIPAYAADFFPLDVWEEMEAWEQNSGGVDETVVQASKEPVARGADKGERALASFPFDVWDALNALGGIDRESMKVFYVNYDAPDRNKTNPYWYPVEYRTP